MAPPRTRFPHPCPICGRDVIGSMCCSRACIAEFIKRGWKERFLSRIDRTGDCWLWTGRIAVNGYGWFSRNGHQEYAHRVAYEVFKGPLSSDLLVCHHCDVRNCVNPDHLFLGTVADNAHDMMSKGRGRYENHPGEQNGQAKLTADKVREIRRLAAEGDTWKSIGQQFGVSKSAVMMIVTRRNWKHVE